MNTKNLCCVSPIAFLPKLFLQGPFPRSFPISIYAKRKDLHVSQIRRRYAHVSLLLKRNRHTLLGLYIEASCMVSHIGEDDEDSFFLSCPLLIEYLAGESQHSENVGLHEVR